MVAMKRIIILLFVLGGFLSAVAQDNEEKKGRPDIPGILQMDWGFNIPNSDNFPTRTFNSRAINIHYFQSFQLGESKISFHPGIGIGIDKFRLDFDSLNREQTIFHAPDSAYFSPLENLDIIKSDFIVNYLEVPVEFRYNTNPRDVSRSFTVAVGAKVGLLLKGKTKYSYNVDTEVHKIKEQHPFHLTRIRYGAYLRVGGGGFNVFVNYMISPIFVEGEGPTDENINVVTTGLSINLF